MRMRADGCLQANEFRRVTRITSKEQMMLRVDDTLGWLNIFPRNTMLLEQMMLRVDDTLGWLNFSPGIQCSE
jgi:hypothetical protein